jgi:hypothetical protein
MACSVYTISHRGHEWQVSGGNAADIAQHYQAQGATVKADMKPERGPNGITIQRLTESELKYLNRIAEANEWDEISHMLKDEWQTRYKHE